NLMILLRLVSSGTEAAMSALRLAQLLHAGHELEDLFGQLDLALGGRAEREAVERGLLHRLQHGGVAVAEDHRAPGADVVDVALALGVDDGRALGAGDEARRAADGAEGAHRGVDAARYDLLGALEKTLVAHDDPSSDGYIGRSPEGTRAGLGAARRSARFALLRISGLAAIPG